MQYTYDSANRLTQVKSAGSQPNLTFSYTYNNRNQVTDFLYPHSKNYTKTYNDDGRLTAIGGNVVVSNLSYNARGLVSEMSWARNNGTHWHYSYDDAGQVIQVVTQDSSHTAANTKSYSYDAAGNKTPGQYSPTNKAEKTPEGWLNIFDANGNMIRQDGVGVQYDFENRRLSSPITKYNALGQPRGCVYDGDKVLLNVKAITNAEPDITQLSSNILGLGGESLASLYWANQIHLYNHFDHIGSVVCTTYSVGMIDNWTIYDAWGKVLSGDGAAFSGVGFAGSQYISGSLYRMGARYYDASQGRFTTRDTMPGNVYEPWTWNLYTYCKNSPLNFIDPTGHSFYNSQDQAPQWVSDEELPYNAPGVQNIIEFAAFVGVVWGTFAAAGVLATVGVANAGPAVMSAGYSALSAASRYGIQTYSKLRESIKGMGLQAHHIIENRLVPALQKLGVNVTKSNSPCVALTPQEHQVFTNLWRQHLPYASDYGALTLKDIYEIAKKVYENYPELLEEVRKVLFGG